MDQASISDVGARARTENLTVVSLLFPSAVRPHLRAVRGPAWRVFFFSSRRRHTRCSRDWSSDVCSSDRRGAQVAAAGCRAPGQAGTAEAIFALAPSISMLISSDEVSPVLPSVTRIMSRSEERRVGEEGRSRWAPYH